MAKFPYRGDSDPDKTTRWFSGEQTERTEEPQQMKTGRRKQFFPSGHSLVHHIERYCRSEVIKHFVLILMVFTQHDPETERQ